MSNSIGRIDLDLGINSSGFKSQLNGITKQAKSSTGAMAGMFGKLGKVVGAAFAVKAVVNFGKQCLQLGSDLAEVQNVVDVTFGSMSSKVNEFAKNAMTSFGMSEKVAKEYMGQFGAMSKAFGNTEQLAYDQAAALTGLAGDVASFYNMSTDEAFTKLKAVYTGETEALKSLGVVMTQAALDEFAMQQGLGKTTKQMSEQEKVALRLQFVTDRLAGASGDFARTADGWANQTRVLSLRFDALKASIGQGLISALTPVIRLLNALMAKLQVAADAFSNFMQSIFGKQSNSPIASLGADLSAGSGDLAENSESAAKSAKAIKKSLAGFDKLNILGGSSDSGSAAGGGASSAGAGSIATPELSNTSGAVDTIKTKLGELKAKLIEFSNITGFTDLWNKFLIGVNNAKTGVKNLFGELKDAITANAPQLETLKTSLTNAFLAISGALTTIWGDMWVIITENFRLWTENHSVELQEFFTNIVSIFTDFYTLISDAVGDIYADIRAGWENSCKSIFDGIIKAIGDVWKWLVDIYNIVIAPIVKKVVEVCKSLWDSTLRPLWQNVLGLLSDFGNYILVLWNKFLKPVVDWIIQKFGPPISKVFQNIVGTVGSVITAIGSILNGLITALRGIIQFLTGVFSGDWKKAWEGIKTLFTGIWKSIKSALGLVLNPIISMMEKFINGIINGINFLIRAINKISFNVPDWVPGIGGKNVGFNLREVSAASLPRLASGGYVAANTQQLAIIGDNKREGEIVAPESKIAEAVARGFAMVMAKMQQPSQQRGSATPVVIKIGETDFWEGFIDFHNSVVMRTGESPLLV
jgi:hypothetical protein